MPVQMNSVHAFRRGEMPLLCMVQRQTTRRITNYDALRTVAVKAGFRVWEVVFENLEPREAVRTMRACDCLVGLLVLIGDFCCFDHVGLGAPIVSFCLVEDQSEDQNWLNKLRLLVDSLCNPCVLCWM